MRALAPLALALTTLLTTAITAPAVHAGAAPAGGYPAPAWPTTDVTLRGHVGVGGGHANHDHRATARRVWVPGAWVYRTERVWVPGRTERVWQEPRFSWRFDACGKLVKVHIGTGSWRTVHHPGHFEERRVRVWQPGHWEVVCT